MSDGAIYRGIPAELHPTLEKSLERLEQHEDWPGIIKRDPEVAAVLNRVLACSEYVADVLGGLALKDLFVEEALSDEEGR